MTDKQKALEFVKSNQEVSEMLLAQAIEINPRGESIKRYEGNIKHYKTICKALSEHTKESK